MIKYKSTRGDNREYTFSQVILKGIADDGGLFVPKRIPKLTIAQITGLQHKSYREIALFLMKHLETDFPDSELREMIGYAYGSNFSSGRITPLKHIFENIYSLELWHGPTAAFKDIALQLMPLLFSKAIKMHWGTQKQYLILVATSGDTGAAALEGYKNKENIKIIALYPENGVSSIQELTMTTFEAGNAKVFSMKGDFDDTQAVIKEIFGDRGFNQKLNCEFNTLLSAANSINWGRLAPQLTYYLSCYISLLEQKRIKAGEEIDVSIPSGNLGNLFAAFFLKSMGLPVRRIICASNSNNALSEFFRTGNLDISGKEIITTHSPSMNILISSNLERLLYNVAGDSRMIKKWMEDLKEKNSFKVDEKTIRKLKKIIYADWVNNKECLDCIKNTLDEAGCLIDPHTAIAVQVAKRYKKRASQHSRPIVVCSTAHWSKFPEDVYRAIYGKTEEKDAFFLLNQIKKRLPKEQIPQSILDIAKKQEKKILVLKQDKSKVKDEIINFLTGN